MPEHDIHITQEGAFGALFARVLAASRKLLTLADLRAELQAQREPIVVGEGAEPYQAQINEWLHVEASRVIADPPVPVQGKGYRVQVVNGTATVGATAYAAEGTLIFREFHSGAWRNRVLIPEAPSDGKQYGRKDAAWTEITASAPPITAQTISTNTTISPTINGAIYNLTLTASVTLTLADFPSATQAARITLVCIQDGTGGRVLTFAGNRTTPGAVAPTFSASANAVDTKTFEWTGATWRLVGSTFDQG